MTATLHFRQFMTSPATLAEAVANAQTALGLPAQPAAPSPLILETPAVTLARQLAEAEARTLYCLDAHEEGSPEYVEALLMEMALRRAQMRMEAEDGR